MFVAAVASTLIVVGAQPAFADVELGHTGTVGTHSLTDTMASPGVTAKYRYYASDGFGWLKRLRVEAPHVRAVAGKSAQTVGWQFTVERKVCGLGGCGTWENRYTSPEMTAVTDDGHDAALPDASVGVTVPCGHNCEDAGATYRVVVKMIWHRGDGSVQGTARHRVYYYRASMDTGETGVMEKTAWDSWSPDWT
jgi:hypothetical protein